MPPKKPKICHFLAAGTREGVLPCGRSSSKGNVHQQVTGTLPDAQRTDRRWLGDKHVTT